MLLVDNKSGLPISASQLRNAIREIHYESLSILEYSLEEQQQANETLNGMTLAELIDLAKACELLSEQGEEVIND